LLSAWQHLLIIDVLRAKVQHFEAETLTRAEEIASFVHSAPILKQADRIIERPQDLFNKWSHVHVWSQIRRVRATGASHVASMVYVDAMSIFAVIHGVSIARLGTSVVFV